VLLFGVAATWDSAMKTTLDSVLIHTGQYNPVDPRACGPYYGEPKGPIEGVCALPNAGYLWLAVLVAVGVVAVYALLARGDAGSVLRAVAHLGSFSVGVAFTLVGLDRAVELGLRAGFALPVHWAEIAHPWNAPYNFVSPATFGLLVLLVFGLWLRSEEAQLPLGRASTSPAMDAVAGAFMAVPFYWGLGRAIYTAFEWWAGSTTLTYSAEWAAALALMATGVGYIALHVHLHAHLHAQSATVAGGNAPLRAFVLALLAGGIVTGAVGLAVALYSAGTALLGVPIADWEQTARAGAAALVVGVALVGIYGWIALRGRYIEPLMAGLGATAGAATAPAAAESQRMAEAIEGVLEEYAAHRVDRDEAAERILELTHPR
jgi:hypothetical protein